MPRSEQLPDSIHGLVGYSGLSVRPNPDFRSDMSRLVRDLRKAVADVRQLRLGQKRQHGTRVVLESQWSRLVAKFSFVPFAFVLLSFFFPFLYWASGFDLLKIAIDGRYAGWLLPNILAGAFLCVMLVFISSFVKYKGKQILEAIITWVSCVSFLGCATSQFVDIGYRLLLSGFGLIFACTFAAVGAIIKTWLLILGRKLES
jgi:hypothetical protein